MSRYILDFSKVHIDIQENITRNHRDFVEDVINKVESNSIVIIGMAMNPHCKRARYMLNREGYQYAYIEHGSYFYGWRKRNALKMWSGWKTFPMIFIQGQLIGGASDLKKFIENGSMESLISL